MAVDGGAQVVHDSLADRVRQQRLRHAQRSRRDRDRDHACHQHRQERGVLAGDRVIEHCAQQERRHHAERRREQDQEED
jgi:hypothetical protein